MEIQIHDGLDGKLRSKAGFYKMHYPFLSLADSICIALADQSGATVVTSDKPFSNVRRKVKIALIR
jgi:Uncharacterized protein conserved in bacteria